jgi:hypothetical protein
LKYRGGVRGFQKAINVLVIAAVLIGLNILAMSEKVYAEEMQKGKCEMTIYSNKHDWTNQAQASGPCAGLVTGYYNGTFHIYGMTTAEVNHNGQVFDVGTPAYKFPTSDLTVYIVVVTEPKPEQKQPDPKPAEKQPAPKPEQKQTAPKPTPKQSEAKPEQKQQTTKPAPKPKQATKTEPKKTENKPPVKTTTTASAKKDQVTKQNNNKPSEAAKDGNGENQIESKLNQLLQKWLDNNKGSLIEKDAKRLIDLGLETKSIPDDLREILINDEVKLNEIIQFFEQKEVKDVRELDSIREQISKIKDNYDEEKQLKEVEEKKVEITKSKEEKVKEGEKTEKVGLIKSMASSISNFFKSIGSFFSNLF